MNFRTEIDIAYSGLALDHSMQGFMAGSCFSENIYRKLAAAKFPVAANPTGILFNPMSIADMLYGLSERRIYKPGDLVHDGNVWFSWDHHGSFSGTDADAALDRMNTAAREGADALAAADYAVITFGTAWLYELASTGGTVANCHKQPSRLFVRRRLTVGEITETYSSVIEGLLKDKAVIFTISPVRHLKDGFEANSLSKAILRTAIGELADRFDNVFYFPAFEIVTDDLRDYRFYDGDMVHPTPQAVDYIWEKFTLWCMDAGTRSLLQRIEAVARAMEHRSIHPGSAADNAFRAAMLANVVALKNELPHIDFSPEEKRFGRREP